MAYNSYRKRTFDPTSTEPHKISRSKIELFLDCPRCFYLDQRHGISRPSFPAFTLNSAVDGLLKKEFDVHRAAGTKHPLLAQHGVNAIPFAHQSMDKWRHNFTGVQHLDEPNNFLVFGAVDDIWVNPEGELHVVDYKATSKDQDPDLEGYWQQAYKRQMEIYQWLLKNNGFKVSPRGYFVYVNGRKDLDGFHGRLEFDTHLIPYDGRDLSWIDDTLGQIRRTLSLADLPPASGNCEYCQYRSAAVEKE